MSRRAANTVEAPGQDSFLDIVANLVGILIILVMVIGVRAQDAMLEAAPVAAEADPEPPRVEQARSAAAAVETDIHGIDEKIKQHQFDIEYRRTERDRAQLLVESAVAVLAEKRSELDAASREHFDTERELIATRSELDALHGQIHSVRSAAAPVTVITHLPTPMAKTVFGQELHFRLADGRLAHVPWDALVNRLREEAPTKLWRLKDQEELTETLGPVKGFVMRYTLARRRHATQTRVGVAIQQGVELDHFVLAPVQEGLGEPLEEAFLDGSQLRSVLDAHPPASSTITVWTYPDSFNEFRELKQFLYQRGYLTASRPLPEGVPIGGSPRGSRSAAQ